MGVPMKKTIVKDEVQNTLSIVKEVPTETKAVVYAEEIKFKREPSYEEMKKISILPSEQDKKEAERIRQKKMITGVFDYKEIPGGTLEFSYNLPFLGEPNIKYILVDGETYTLPKGVVKHLKESGFVYVNEHALDPLNPRKSNIKIGKKVLRYDFHPEFNDPDLKPLEENNIFLINR